MHLSLESDEEENQLLFHSKEHAYHPCMISFVHVTKYLKIGYQGFLASVGESSIEHQEIDPSIVRVVRE